MNKSFNIEEDAQEEDADKKKHKHESADHLRSRSLDSMPPVSSSTQHSNNKNETTTTIMDTSSSDVLMNKTVSGDGGDDDPLFINTVTSTSFDAIMENDDSTIMTKTEDETMPRPRKWSLVLATPTNLSPLFTPTSDITSLKQNLHGLGLKYSIDRSKILSRTGKGCATLLSDIAILHDELCSALNKLCPSILENASIGTPLESFTVNVITKCIASYVTQTKLFGTTLKNDISKPYANNSTLLLENVMKQYTAYTTLRTKCVGARKDGLKLRKRYVESVTNVDAAINALKKSRAAKGRKRTSTQSSNDSGYIIKDDTAANTTTEGGGVLDNNGEDNVESNIPTSSSSANNNNNISWQDELRQYGMDHGLAKQCENVIKATEDVSSAQLAYERGVAVENTAVNDANEMELKSLDEVQKLEEVSFAAV